MCTYSENLVKIDPVLSETMVYKGTIKEDESNIGRT